MYRRPRLARPFPPSAWRPPSGTRTRCPPAARGLSPRRPPGQSRPPSQKPMMPETRKPTAKLESALSSSPSGWTISLTRSMMIVWMPCTTCSAAPALMVMTMRRSRAADVAPVERRKVALARKMPEGIGDELVILQQLGYGDGDEFIEIVKIVVKRSRDCTGRRGSPRQPTARRCCCSR